MSPPSQLRKCLLTNGALIHILVTCAACEAWWTGTDGPAIHRVRVADSILMTGIADTGIIQMTQKPWKGYRQKSRAGSPALSKVPTAAQSVCVVFLLTQSVFSSYFFPSL